MAPNAPLEASKHRHLVAGYCTGNGADLGPFTDPITPHSIRIDRHPDHAHFTGDVRRLPFRDGVLDYVHASHVLEDFANWTPVLNEWARVIAPGGFLVVSVPDRERFRERVRLGQPDNLDHKHEGRLGEVESYLPRWRCLLSQFVTPDDYSIVVVMQKP